MGVADRIYTMRIYSDLQTNPLHTLQQNDLMVNQLPAVNDATVQNLWFAAHDHSMAIDQSDRLACALVQGPEDCGIQRPMVVSAMRGFGLPPGGGAGARHQPTRLLNTRVGTTSLWVTQQLTGCTVLIVDWGAGQYSMTHLQPGEDAQFNRLGQAILNTGEKARSAYKNIWLKKEMTTIVQHTGGSPQHYIMIQSMFETARGNITQVIGVLQGAQWQFYRQRQSGAHRLVQQLHWSSWHSYMPYFSY